MLMEILAAYSVHLEAEQTFKRRYILQSTWDLILSISLIKMVNSIIDIIEIIWFLCGTHLALYHFQSQVSFCLTIQNSKSTEVAIVGTIDFIMIFLGSFYHVNISHFARGSINNIKVTFPASINHPPSSAFKVP